MNIQSLISNINTVINSVNSRPVDSASAEQVVKEGQAAPAAETTADTQTNDVRLSDRESVNSLLKELASKFTTAQKSLESMPDNIRSELRQLLSQKATLFDMSGGLSNLVQGQKEIFGNLNRLAETLSNLAKFMSEAERPAAQEQSAQLPQGSNGQGLTKEAVLEKMDAKLIKQLLEYIEKGNQLPEVRTQNAQQNQPTESKNTALQKAVPEQEQNQKEAAKQPEQTMINRQTANSGMQMKQGGADIQKEAIEFLKNLYQEVSQGEANRQGQPVKESQSPVKEEVFLKEQQPQNKEQLMKSQNTRLDTADFFKNATLVKGLAETLGKENLSEILNSLKMINDKAASPEQLKPDEMPKNAQTANQQTQNLPKQVSEGNVLLQQARQALPEQTQIATNNVTSGQVAQLANNMKTFSLLMEQNAAGNPQLARALQTLNSNPALLSMEEKVLLQSVIAQIIKDVFKSKEEIGVLEKALNRLSDKNKMFLDKDTADLQTFSKLLKNTDTLQYSRQQVDRWASALRDLAGGMAKTSGFAAERSSQHLHSSFVFNLATDGQERNNPVYINVYHEKENLANTGKAAETWLRVKVEPEYMGEVTAIFHLYQENLLDVKVIFNNPEAMDEFTRFVPHIEEALQNTNMQLNSIMLM